MKRNAHLTKQDDQELVARFIAGNDRCFDILVQRHRAKALLAIRQIVKNEDVAEDLLQETLIKMVDTLKHERYKEEGKFLPYLLRIARNMAIDYFRKSKRNRVTYNTDGLNKSANRYGVEPTIVQDLSRKTDRAAMRAMINELPPNQRETLILRQFNDFTFKEIAEFTDVSINTALGRMRYAMINLKKIANGREFGLMG